MSFTFLKSKPAMLLTILLLTQALLLVMLNRREAPVNTLPLKDVPPVLGNWKIGRAHV